MGLTRGRGGSGGVCSSIAVTPSTPTREAKVVSHQAIDPLPPGSPGRGTLAQDVSLLFFITASHNISSIPPQVYFDLRSS